MFIGISKVKTNRCDNHSRNNLRVSDRRGERVRERERRGKIGEEDIKREREERGGE